MSSQTPSQSRSSRRNRNRSRRQGGTSVQPEPPQQMSDAYDDESTADFQSPSPQRRRGPRQQKRVKDAEQDEGDQPLDKVGGVNDLLPANQAQGKGGAGDQAKGQLSNVAGGGGGPLGGVLGGGGQEEEGGGKSDTLRLRLDLNLEVEVTLKARIHGDLELALLDGS